MKTGNHRGYLIPTVQTILLALAWLVPTLPVAQVAAVPSRNSAAGLAAFPLKVSANGRYLVDQDNTPFLITGDGPHGLIAMLSTADAASHFDNRQADGFNAVWINMLVASPAYYDSRDDGSTYDGIRPFTGYVSGGTDTAHYDLTKPNEAYFARVDQMLTLAAKHSMVVFLDPIDTCCSAPPTRTMWLRVLHINGLTGAGAYGRYLGKRFKRFDNIIWLNGDDFNTWKDPDDDTVVRAVAEGIKAAAPRHLRSGRAFSFPYRGWALFQIKIIPLLPPGLEITGTSKRVSARAIFALPLKLPMALTLWPTCRLRGRSPSA